MYKVDLHTHSTASADGGIRPEQYRHMLSSGKLDCIAITDHNRIDMAVMLKKELGKKIIVGEEIMTTAGEIIGLFLERAIAPHQSPLATVQAIKAQGGMVYVPHPFETVRNGIAKATLQEIADYVDIVEVHNGRAVFQNRGPEAAAWATLNHCLRATGSDAHGVKGLGTCFNLLEKIPTKRTMLQLMAKARLITNPPPLRTLLYPKLNRLSKRLRLRP